MYVELTKALYGTIKAALLFWKKLSATLKKWEFTANPYNSCVVNKMIKGSQRTILWQVDDLKISHIDLNVVTAIIKLLEGEFGKDASLTITHGKVQDYLGMTINYISPGKVKISMINYIDNMLAELPDDMSGESATPAGNHLYQVNTVDGIKPTEEHATLFIINRKAALPV